MAESNAHILDLLKQAYFDELETVMNYLANSVQLDGIRAAEIKQALADDVQEELSHAEQIAARIKILGGDVPGSEAFRARQSSLQPPQNSTDVVAVIKGVIEAENMAIEGYTEIIKATDGLDYVTQDMAIAILADEEDHRREFRGFLKEFEQV